MANNNRPRNRRSMRRSGSITQQTASCAGEYAHALLQGREAILDEKTLYTAQGGAGSTQSSIKQLQNSGATGVAGVLARGDQAAVMFQSSTGEIVGIGLFDVLGGKHIKGDWQFFENSGR